MSDISEIISMATECGCLKYGLNSQIIICKKCASAASRVKR